jgi:hypothetical protein
LHTDLEWFFDFVFVGLRRVRPSTRGMVYSLDFRRFAKDTYHFRSDDDARSMPSIFRQLPVLFPNLRCVLLDGHAEIDPALLTLHAGSAPPPDRAGSAGALQRPLLLSVAHCQRQLPTNLFTSSYLESVVYLDVSALAGSLKPLLVAAALPHSLPSLRALKARNREVDDSTAALLFKTFLSRLWSLDLSDNNLSDAVIDVLRNSCFISVSLRSDSSFRTEGKLVFPDVRGNDIYGPFKFIKESQWSGTFSHPERYFVDTPMYSVEERGGIPQEDDITRSEGRSPVKGDSTDSIKRVLAGGSDHIAPTSDEVLHLDVCMSPIGITHLHLSNNNLTAAGIEKLLRLSPGQLEYFACDYMPIRHLGVEWWPGSWPKSTKLFGILGAAHVFRPLFSSNLRVLRIHHSLVTQIPTLEAEGVSAIARLWVAETSIRERAELAYPQAFVPDMNPRLTSLTLTHIPRRAVGPLIDKLIGFLKLAAIQERAIKAATLSSSRRSPAMLWGLRHIRLEFEPDPADDPAGLSIADDLDAEDLLAMDEGEGFSFFGDESPTRRQRRSSATRRNSSEKNLAAASSHHPPSATDGGEKSARLQHFPYGQNKSEYFVWSGKWNNQLFTMPVWIGPGVLGPHHAINEYMMLLQDPALMTNVGPAMPAHVLAGVPEGECLFYDAWDAMLLPRDVKFPERGDLKGMKDVVEAVKGFRRETRTKYENETVEGEFWSGQLEIVSLKGVARYDSSEFWR